MSTNPTTVRLGAALLASLALVLARPASSAGPFSQLSPADRAMVAAARVATDAACDCGQAAGHRSYLRCVARTLKAEVAARRLPRKQLHQVMQCAGRSTCGRAAKVTCCTTNRRGREKCRIVPAAKCRAPRAGTACVTPFASLCDAATQGCAPAQVPHDEQCCLPVSPGGAFPDENLTCELLKPEECTSMGGTPAGEGGCDPDPCGTTTTTTTTTTTQPRVDVPCCVPVSPGSTTGTCELLKPDECTGLGGVLLPPGACDVLNCTLGTTTTTESTTTSTTSTTTTESTSTSTTASTSSTSTITKPTSTSTSSTSTTTVPKAGFCGDRVKAPCAVTVDEPGGSFDDLQRAIDAADDGATITVEGRCHGPIQITGRANLTITGTPPAKDCPDGGPGPADLGSTVEGGDHVIKVTGSDKIHILFLNVIGGDSEGVEFKQSENDELRCSCVAHNGDEGVELHGGQGHQVRQNLIARNQDDGISLPHGTHDNTVSGNTVRENGDDGIEVEADGNGNVIADNLIEKNGEDGIDLDGANRNRITGNEIRDNGNDKKDDTGIELEDSDDNTVDGNVIRDNADGLVDKIRCQDGSDGNDGSNVTKQCK